MIGSNFRLESLPSAVPHADRGVVVKTSTGGVSEGITCGKGATVAVWRGDMRKEGWGEGYERAVGGLRGDAEGLRSSFAIPIP